MKASAAAFVYALSWAGVLMLVAWPDAAIAAYTQLECTGKVTVSQTYTLTQTKKVTVTRTRPVLTTLTKTQMRTRTVTTTAKALTSTVKTSTVTVPQNWTTTVTSTDTVSGEKETVTETVTETATETATRVQQETVYETVTVPGDPVTNTYAYTETVTETETQTPVTVFVPETLAGPTITLPGEVVTTTVVCPNPGANTTTTMSGGSTVNDSSLSTSMSTSTSNDAPVSSTSSDIPTTVTTSSTNQTTFTTTTTSPPSSSTSPSALCSPAYNPNYILNPSFENGSIPWSSKAAISGTSVSLALSSAAYPSHSGQYSFRSHFGMLTADTVQLELRQLIVIPGGICAGAQYTVGLWARNPQAAGINCTAAILLDNGTMASGGRAVLFADGIPGDGMVDGATWWSQYSATFTADGSEYGVNGTTLRLRTSCAGYGTDRVFYVDDVWFGVAPGTTV